MRAAEICYFLIAAIIFAQTCTRKDIAPRAIDGTKNYGSMFPFSISAMIADDLTIHRWQMEPRSNTRIQNGSMQHKHQSIVLRTDARFNLQM
jgi:hypothetical protein